MEFRDAIGIAREGVVYSGNNEKEGGGLNSYGTAVLTNIINASGIYPTRNFQTGVLDKDRGGKYAGLGESLE